MIRKLNIFKHWGIVVFEARDIEAGKEAQGWDDTFEGQVSNLDVFT